MTTRASGVRRALAVSATSVAWSGVVGSTAVAIALGTSTLSLLGFGADAVIDSIASVALIWRFLAETRAPERAARVEHLAERIVGLALIALALYLAVGSIRALVAQSHPEGSTIGVALLIASAIVLPPLALMKVRTAARLTSGALRADGVLTAVAAGLAAISLVSLALTEAAGLWWADSVAALIVAGVIVREGLSSVRAQLVEDEPIT